MKWEYKTDTIQAGQALDAAAFDKELNRWGDSGWELVAVHASRPALADKLFSKDEGGIVCTFKRRVG